MSLPRIVAASLLVFSTACSTTSPGVSTIDTVSPSRELDLDGRYRFESIDACVRSTSMSPDAALLLPLEEMLPGSEVIVEESASELRFRFTDLDGDKRVVAVPIEDVQRRGDHLFIRGESKRPAFFPGIAGQSQSCSVYRGDDGSLVMLDRSARTGLAMFLVPFRDRSEMIVTLKPVQ